ncbi:response regulator transcription factor [Actinocatenispora rupis]|uniref:Sensory transduction protein RegX3 n=1 Tax=Actinocatenispora rupis TaxID=519421 RepID=A0A8J3NCW1_9ACTN|nr:response regulator transcription factor [Actinocatenispora rupis]GID14734.1 DNA-binding response regulator [Actinocatenispora rupis]
MEILVVEDDVRLADALCVALRRRGYGVTHVGTGAEALAAPPCDLVLLDLGLPDMDGLAVCKQLQGRSDVAVIVLTARGEERDRVLGLRTGADDYLVKPFSMAELTARIEAVLRRHRPRPAGPVAVGALRIDLDARQVSVADAPVALRPKEYELLVVLAREAGAVVPRHRLIMEVWRATWPGAARTLEVHIGSLRSKISAAGRIEAVHGVGYRFDPEGAGHVS